MKPRPTGARLPRLYSAPAYLTFLALMFLLAAGTSSQQEADSTFDVRVAHPSYTTTHPKVLFDEAHNNFHTSSGRYKPFADLISNDGYQVLPNKRKFEKQTLEGFDVLVSANALGSPDVDTREASNPAFTELECDAVRDWVREGGNLYLSQTTHLRVAQQQISRHASASK